MANNINEIALSLVKGLGPVTTRNLISEVGSVDEVFSEKDKNLLLLPSINQSIVDSIRDDYIFQRAEQEMNFMAKNGVTSLFYLDKEFPKRFDFCSDAPVLIYTKGNLNLNTRKVLAMVGTRSATPYGRDMCKKIISELKQYNPLIISGLALGVDIATHKAAVEHNLQTVGCLAHGVDSIYPPSSRVTAEKMMSNGGVVSEFMSGTVPIRENFPTRNRVIAGMCDALIIVESKKRGGSMISAEIAYGYNKDVFAVPGKASDSLSEGCNDLIKFQKAIMVTGGKDVARELSWDKQAVKKAVQPELFPELSIPEMKALNTIKSNSQIMIDDLGEKTGLNNSELAQILLQLEFSGLIRALPGKVYESA